MEDMGIMEMKVETTIGVSYGVYRDTGKEDGTYYLGFRV